MDAKQVNPEDQPNKPAGSSVNDWFRQNTGQLVVVIAVIAAICTYLHPLDVLLGGAALSLIIFLHELGHFAAAKLCDVHVKTFSIGFGPALPFCRFQYGETTYKLAMIPLGGFVAMVGEGDEEGDVVEGEPDPEVAASDPRSFKNKSVFQRMLIISAGVIMNMLLGCACFIAAYVHGLEEVPAIASQVESGSAAWQAGIRPGTEIARINSREHPWFDDLKIAVMSTQKGEKLNVDLKYPGNDRTVAVEPVRQEGVLYPTLGISPPPKPTLRSLRREKIPPYLPASPASEATGPNGVADGFQPGDEIVGMTDPDQPTHPVTPLNPKADGLPGAYFDLQRRLIKLAANPDAGQHPVTFEVKRKDAPPGSATVKILCPLGRRQDIGLRMRPGFVAAVRVGSPAEKAGIRPAAASTGPGDKITTVEVPEPDGSRTRYSSGVSSPQKMPELKLNVLPLDPLRLPFELAQWADRQTASGKPNLQTVVTVLREADHTEKPVEVPIEWDQSYRYDVAKPITAGAPVAISGLGLAYYVMPVVNAVAPGSPADAAGLKPDDQIKEVRFYALGLDGTVKQGKWSEVRPHQWAYADFTLQSLAPYKLDVKVERQGEPVREVTLQAQPDQTWPTPELGLDFLTDTREQKADGVLDAVDMGVQRTTRSVKSIYLSLYAMVFGRLSPLNTSGPINLGKLAYLLAGEDVWHLLLFMGLISVNLAVVNFLPIPVLDGGHMVFLIYEWLRGKPAPMWAQVGAMYIGLAMVLSLMLFVIGLDVWRLIFA